MNIEREAIAVLARDGWRKAGKRERDGSTCVYVAMARVLSTRWPAFDAAAERVAAVIREQYPERVSAGLLREQTMFRFNDHPATTVDDVVAVLEKAALLADEVVG